MSVGNVFRHDYDNVQETLVWTTVQGHLAPLLAAIAEEIEAFGVKP